MLGQAEFQRDVIAEVAVNEAANREIAQAEAVDARIVAGQNAAAVKAITTERDVIARVAANEAVHREVAEAQAVDARITANQSAAAATEMATERNLLHSDLAAERHASSNNAFGFYLMTGLVLAMLLVGGIYFYFQRQDAANAAQPGTTVTVNGTTPSSVSTTTTERATTPRR